MICRITKRLSKTGFSEADGKCPDARLPKFRGMRRTQKYAAVTRNEGNAANGRFPTASRPSIIPYP
jgi:hypothetical protein